MIEKQAQRTKLLTDKTIVNILKLAQKKGIISFGGGIPNPCLFPLDFIVKKTDQILKKEGKIILQYNQTQGYPPLLVQLAQYYSQKWQIKLKPENFLITNGSQQALDILAKFFLDKDDFIIVENPTYFAGISVFNAYQPKYQVVNLENDGLDVVNFQKKLNHSHLKLKFAYLIPNFQNPTGITLSLEKRKKLAALASYKNIWLIEDDAYGELYFQKPPPPALFVFNPHQVIYVGTFSKSLAPGLRVGFILAKPQLIKKLALIKQSMDIHTPVLSQAITAKFLEDKKFFQNHLKKIRKFYQKQKQTMIQALSEAKIKNLSWTNPLGGLFVWLTLPSTVNIKNFYRLSLKNKVSFVPGYIFYAQRKNYHTLRLSYATVSQKQIRTGVRKLVNLIQSQ